MLGFASLPMRPGLNGRRYSVTRLVSFRLLHQHNARSREKARRGGNARCGRHRILWIVRRPFSFPDILVGGNAAESPSDRLIPLETQTQGSYRGR